MPKIDITNNSSENSGQMPVIKTRSESLGMPKLKDAKSLHHVGDSVKFTKITAERKTETSDSIEIERITEVFEKPIPEEAPKEAPNTEEFNQPKEKFDIELKEEKMQTEPKPEKKEKKKKKLSKGLKIASAAFFFIFLASIILVFTKAALADALNALPEKILIPAVIATSAATLLFCAISFLSNFRKAPKIIAIVFEVILSAILFYASSALDTVFGFLNGIQASNYQIESFYVLVKSDSEISTIEEISDKTIAVYEDTTDVYQEALKLLSEKSTAEQISYKDFVDAGTALKENTNEAMFIKGSMKEVAEEIIPDFSTKIIDTIEVKTILEESETEKTDVSKESFNVFISGIDTYGDISTVSRSDVNMIATINPKTNKILLTSIPRDFYVQLHNTAGLKDKLTHAGIYGVDMSRQTLEDLFNIKIDYYAKVNFSSLISIVDSIGGITITSDMALTLSDSGRTCYYQAGANNVDGFCALRFARERHSYAEGDRHRVQNQQEVLTAIINKVTSSKSIILNYAELLNGLGGSIQTNIPTSQIYKLVNLQLNDMPSWTIDRTQVDGAGSMDYTYSIPSQLLYVMVPNQDTVDAAIDQINRTMYPENYINETTEGAEEGTEEITE